MRLPILGLFGGEDPGIPLDTVEAFDEALDGAGVEHEIVVYPGAPHSFFDRRYAEWADACADAWRRVLDFLSGVGSRVAG
jgi:carboxymethylenebutenolidase